MRKVDSLKIRVGPSAYRDIRKQGFDLTKIKAILGASGGPKWLVLSHLDRLILEKIIPQIKEPIHLIASSIGVWRFICYTQNDPVAAINEFERGYIEQQLPKESEKKQISHHLRVMLDMMCNSSNIKETLQHPQFRTSIITTKNLHILKSEQKILLSLGLLASLLANLTSRRALKYFYSRGLFFDPREAPLLINNDDFTIDAIPLTHKNLKDAIIASSSIPLFMEGVRGIRGAPEGVYRDGGLLDYHLDFLPVDREHYALYPHFFDRLKPGWFDSSLSWRNVQLGNLDRTIFICPSEEFIKKLPGSKVPDRSDFKNFSNSERIKRWRTVTDMSKVLAEEFNEILEKDQLADHMISF